MNDIPGKPEVPIQQKCKKDEKGGRGYCLENTIIIRSGTQGEVNQNSSFWNVTTHFSCNYTIFDIFQWWEKQFKIIHKPDKGRLRTSPLTAMNMIFVRMLLSILFLSFYSKAISQGASGCIEQHPGHFQPSQCYIPYSETWMNSMKYPKKSVNDPDRKSVV